MTAVVLRGDARHLPLPDASVDLIVTSPPFWQLRSYTDGGEHYDGQVGSEPTPGEYLDSLLACTREWVRVVKPSGSLFVNLGDKYAGAPSGPRTPMPDGYDRDSWRETFQGRRRTQYQARDKSLMGLPWRYALACMDELGLILRRDIIWSKPNGLPESVTDRCRSSHEYLFHFTVRPRYYAAVDEIRESYSDRVQDRQRYSGRDIPASRGYAPQNRNDSDRARGILGFGADGANPLGKLPGSVWEIPSQPLSVPAGLGVDHFAAFPMELPRRCILGWSPPGICTACGEGRTPVTDGERLKSRPVVMYDHGSRYRSPLGRQNGDRESKTWAITGYACGCPDATAPVRPAVVVDPFGGTGTTALVASMLGRLGFSFDLAADYCRLARWRTTDPAERAKALHVPKPPKVAEGQMDLFDAEVLDVPELSLAESTAILSGDLDAS